MMRASPNSTRFRALPVILLGCLCVLVGNVLKAQPTSRSSGNISRLGSSTGQTQSNANFNRRLLPLVINSSGSANGIQAGRDFQSGAIVSLPNYVSILSAQYLWQTQMASHRMGPEFNSAAQFHANRAQRVMPMYVDRDDMAIETSEWANIGAFTAKYPILQGNLSYDSNAGNETGTRSETSVVQTTRMRFPFAIGEDPGHSWTLSMFYTPEYEAFLAGNNDNSHNHSVQVQLGREFSRTAIGLNHRFNLDSTPARELSGRNRSIRNASSIKIARDVTQKSLLLYEVGHSISTRKSPSSGTSQSTQSIISDNLSINYFYIPTQKLSIQPSVIGRMDNVVNRNINSQTASLKLLYTISPKLIVSGNTGIQFRQQSETGTQISEIYNVDLSYNVRPKLVFKTGIDRMTRPSFALDGAILNETILNFKTEYAFMRKWLLGLTFDYTIRRENAADELEGLNQSDRSVTFDAEYLMNRTTSFGFFASSFTLNDHLNNEQSRRISFGINFTHAF